MPILFHFSKKSVNYDCICFIINELRFKGTESEYGKAECIPRPPDSRIPFGDSAEMLISHSLKVDLDRFQSQMEQRASEDKMARALAKPANGKLPKMGRGAVTVHVPTDFQ